jgi:hypothetical protein
LEEDDATSLQQLQGGGGGSPSGGGGGGVQQTQLLGDSTAPLFQAMPPPNHNPNANLLNSVQMPSDNFWPIGRSPY